MVCTSEMPAYVASCNVCDAFVDMTGCCVPAYRNNKSKAATGEDT